MLFNDDQRSDKIICPKKCVPAEAACRHAVTYTPGNTLSLVGWRPAKSPAERLPVELALHWIDGASVVESEHFIIQIQAIRYRGESFRQFIGSLQVDLQVRVEVVISIGPL